MNGKDVSCGNTHMQARSTTLCVKTKLENRILHVNYFKIFKVVPTRVNKFYS